MSVSISVNELSPVLAIMGGVWLLLIAATVVVWRLTPAPDSELRQRLRSWWLIVALCSLALAFSRTIALVFFAMVSFLALKEYLTLIPTRRTDRRVLFWAYLSIPVQYFWIHVAWYGMFIIFIPVYLFLLLPVAMVLIGETQGHLRAAGTLHWGLMSMVFSLSHLAYLLVLPQGEYPQVSGAGLVLFLLLLTELNDVAQYCWGKLLGKHKISPLVSPNKTVEGFVGGVATTVLLSVLLGPWLTPFTGSDAVLAGLLIAVAGFFGDLSLSALKRDLGIKDSGRLLPGHGGILDRVDSLTYTAPLFFHFIRYFYF
ncbi:MAG TPA: phosphatidate cytidylyltransferase [Candidatus Competibacteraceae bacterium]|nr:MAG: phosphatidate cytidylyltransferase [Candidatus Competibacteraceae bacterium]HOB61677.1 phosphatidate cytidylyltransferase [Candidatus Competibacteraceae bacterium]HQA26380.1 phosphatidate cytidylyltransferase [Candidatus Competibacteraceae bacterium]HQD57284.1 phosphatidate cytidylyltransferase [Candidatus Competibacteraceae bacterium]